MSDPDSRLSRRLGTFDAVVVGLASMIGAGIFAAVGPAAAAAGSGLLIGLLIAGVVALCNAVSSAKLAAVYPESGGAYVYGRKRLGRFWGYLAGWAFVAGKTSSCAAIALTFGAYAAPRFERPLAVTAVVGVTLVNHLGVRKTAWVTRATIAVVLAALAAVVVGSLAGGTASVDRLSPIGGNRLTGIFQSAGLLFFAFAGYARIATLGEEVTDPAATIPRAIPLALGITLVVYAAVAASALVAVGPARLAAAEAPLATAVQAGALSWLSPAVRIGGTVAALGVLVSLLAGVSRTAFAMAAKGDLPRWLDAVHPSHRVPHHAGLGAGALVAGLTLFSDLRGAIGFSSFAVLVYYAIANASAWTLSEKQRPHPRWVSAFGLTGCLLLAFTLPAASVLTGLGVVAAGASVWFLGRRTA